MTKNNNSSSIHNKINGWISIYKEPDMTSFQVVRQVRKILNIKKIGHGGTLDPFATGVLPIAINEATKTVDYVMDHEKEYKFTITFGEEKNTGDLTGETTQTSKTIPTKQEIQKILPNFIGEIEQTPPRYSAIKIEGKRAYDLARNNKEFEIKSRKVQIHNLKLLQTSDKTADFITTCSKGTYIRSLAQDIAKSLNTYGHVSKLERTKVGQFTKKNSITLFELEKLVKQNNPEKYIISINSALPNIPSIKVTDSEELEKLTHGNPIYSKQAENINNEELIKLLNQDNKVIALARKTGNKVQPFKVLL
jgi:tRNA pseudouridine55 synthase